MARRCLELIGDRVSVGSSDAGVFFFFGTKLITACPALNVSGMNLRSVRKHACPQNCVRTTTPPEFQSCLPLRVPRSTNSSVQRADRASSRLIEGSFSCGRARLRELCLVFAALGAGGSSTWGCPSSAMSWRKYSAFVEERVLPRVRSLSHSWFAGQPEASGSRSRAVSKFVFVETWHTFENTEPVSAFLANGYTLFLKKRVIHYIHYTYLIDLHLLSNNLVVSSCSVVLSAHPMTLSISIT